MKTIIFCLGRFGDVINALPLAWIEAQHGNRTSVCVAAEFQSIMDGVTYADRIVWPGRYNEPDRALSWLRNMYPAAKIVNAQAYRHPTDKQRLTPSYQTEAWRLAGRLEEFGMWPTVFDGRSESREEALRMGVADGTNRPMILVGLESVSSPLKRSADIMRAIKEQFGQAHRVVNLAEIRAQRIYDLLGLFDRAACLVTADTAFLHLARASKVPAVALISEGNVGVPVAWFGSVPPPNCVASMRYGLAAWDFNPMLDAVNRATLIEAGDIIHVADNFGRGNPLDNEARKTWIADFTYQIDSWKETKHDRPFLKEALRVGFEHGPMNNDIVLWSNGDTAFTQGAFQKIRRHVALWGATSIRRVETHSHTEPHIGRDVFAFRSDWLRANIDSIPDFLMGACTFDLVLAALIRKTRGVPSNKENLHHDIFPCEMPAGLILHEPHESSWSGALEHTLPANLHNKALAREWCEKEMTTLKL